MVARGLAVEFVKDIPVAALVDLLVEEVEEFVVVVQLAAVEVAELGEDLGLELVVVELLAPEDRFVLTIHTNIVYNNRSICFGDTGRTASAAKEATW
jgi:hypothetical protein